MFRFRDFLIFVLALPWLANAEDAVRTVNLTAADRGGFGDLVSNIFMAKQLKARRPALKLRFFVTEVLVEKASTLLNFKFDADHPFTVVDGIEYHYLPRDVSPPPADVALEFSIPASRSEPVHQSAPFLLSFDEYSSDLNSDYFSHKGWFPENSNQPGLRRNGVLLQGSTLTLHFNTGPGHTGYYISPATPEPPGTRKELFEKIRKQFGVNLSDKAVLGHAYTYGPNLTAQYLEAMALAAAKPPLSKKEIVLVVKNFYQLKTIELPKNIRLVTFDSLPLDLSTELIAHADLPIAVTGDMSLTLALEYEKPFFYEMLAHKVSVAKGTAREISQVLSADLTKAEQSRFRRAMTTELFTDEMAMMIAMPRFKNLFQKAIRTIRTKASIPDALLQRLDVLPQLSPRLMTHTALKEVFTWLAEGIQPKNLFPEAFRIIRDRSAGEKRLGALRVLSCVDPSKVKGALDYQLWAYAQKDDPALSAQAREILLQWRKSSPWVLNELHHLKSVPPLWQAQASKTILDDTRGYELIANRKVLDSERRLRILLKMGGKETLPALLERLGKPGFQDLFSKPTIINELSSLIFDHPDVSIRNMAMTLLLRSNADPKKIFSTSFRALREDKISGNAFADGIGWIIKNVQPLDPILLNVEFSQTLQRELAQSDSIYAIEALLLSVNEIPEWGHEHFQKRILDRPTQLDGQAFKYLQKFQHHAQKDPGYDRALKAALQDSYYRKDLESLVVPSDRCLQTGLKELVK